MAKLGAAVALLQAYAGNAASNWVYANNGERTANAAAQTATWGGLCNSGHEQSPINVVTASATKTAMPRIETHFNTVASYVKNTGHGFQLFETSPLASQHRDNNGVSEVDMIGGSNKGYSIIGGSKYNFYQVHWHTPSENTIDGQSFPLEAHFVHQLDDQALVGGYHRLAVIGLMYELGNDNECNTFLDKFWSTFPSSKGVAQYHGDNFDLNQKLTAELAEGYYHWYGSLTTPPCTEGVSWNLLKRKEKVCQRQVDWLKQALGATQGGIDFNNRVVQPLNHRIVAEMAADASRAPVNNIAPIDFAPTWAYARPGDTVAHGPTQAQTWDNLCATGQEQSPINVVTADVRTAGPAQIRTYFDTRAEYLKNTGHGFQVFETSPQNHNYNATDGSVMVDDFSGRAKGHSMIAGDRFNFYQVHWHTPSENTVDGISYPLEAHFVHQLDDVALHGTYHRLAVIGLLYELGTDQECNAFLDKFWSQFPVNRGVSQYTGDNFDLNAKLTQELAEGYWHWYGSLTTPPCTEGVSWNLLKRREKVCQRQVDALKAALSATQSGLGFNNRVTQPLNHRIVTETTAASSQWLYANPGETVANPVAQASTWGGLCASGLEQSPIDVVTANTVPARMPTITTHMNTVASYVKNTGHGFQLFETSPSAHQYNGVTSQVDAIGGSKGYSDIGGSRYNFYQVHWHTPSENTIDGQSFPLEAHFVHQLADPALHGTYHRLAVIGLLYELGNDTECNDFLDQFWSAFPNAKGSAPYTGQNFDLNAKLSAELAGGYYHWYGSLTTPPCTEGVSWNLLMRREKVCQRQIDRLKFALGQTQAGIQFNNRVVQPLYHRKVTAMAPDVTQNPTNNQNSRPTTNTNPWVYARSGETTANAAAQAETWGAYCNEGREQSPINVVTRDVWQGNNDVITTHFNTTASYVKNTGHGFQVFETNPYPHAYQHGSVSVDDVSGRNKGYSMIAGDRFNFYQVHWHTPSENTIDGRSYALEAHFVHQLDDPALHGTLHRLAVIGLLYELGTDSECNPFLDKFWNTFPMEKGVTEYTADNFDLNVKLTEELAHGYWHWYGSLTTPPCTQGVSWNLLKRTEKVCQRQVDRLKAALYATQNGINFNNRVVQPLHHRVVTDNNLHHTQSSSQTRETEASSAMKCGLQGGLVATAAAVLARP